MLARRLVYPSPLKVFRPHIILRCHPRRSFHWCLPGPRSSSQKLSGISGAQKCFRRGARLAAWRRNGAKTRAYSDDAQTRIQDEGIPLHNSGPTTAALLAYAQTHWPAPSVIPPGWSADWRKWDYLLTLFAFSPYFLRLPQIEMLVNVKYAIPGEVRPIMFSTARESVVFCVEMPPPEDGAEDDNPDGAAHVFLLNCRTFDLYTYDPLPPATPSAKYAENAPDTIEELVILIGAAPTPAAVPMLRLEPDEEGETVLQRILDRDPTVVAVLEAEYLGYAPRVTTREEELFDPNNPQDQASAEAARRRRAALGQAIEAARATVRETEAELARDEAEVRRLRGAARTKARARESGTAPRPVTGTLGLAGAVRELTAVGVDGLEEVVSVRSQRSSEGEDEFEVEPSAEDIEREDAAHAEMRAALEEAKARLEAMEREWDGLIE